MTDHHLRVASMVALVVGLGLMIPFEHAATLAVGVTCLFAFIVLGLFGLVTPERLASQTEDGDPPESQQRPSSG
jgi:hypothetical protein